jgi:predicted DNA-binding transcriptional regulator AlpA
MVGGFLTVRQVGELLTLSRSTLSRLAQRGELVPIALTAGRVAYRSEDVDAFILRRTTKRQALQVIGGGRA